MKTKMLFSFLLSIACLAVLPACKTTATGQSVADIDRIARVSRQAASIGARETLQYFPQFRPDLQLAHDELVTLENSQTIDLNSILDIISKLPDSALHTEYARLSVDGARLLISAIDLPEVDASTLAELKPIVTALRQGLEDGGLAPTPAAAPATSPAPATTPATAPTT
jgi:hypothetical protein